MKFEYVTFLKNYMKLINFWKVYIIRISIHDVGHVELINYENKYTIKFEFITSLQNYIEQIIFQKKLYY